VGWCKWWGGGPEGGWRRGCEGPRNWWNGRVGCGGGKEGREKGGGIEKRGGGVKGGGVGSKERAKQERGGERRGLCVGNSGGGCGGGGRGGCGGAGGAI